MLRFVILALVVVVPIQAQTHTCRTDAVVPGGTCYVWFPAGGVTQSPQVPSGWVWQRPATYGDIWHNQWAWEIKAAVNAKPGDYNVGGVNITVVKAPKKRPLRRISVSNSYKDASKYIVTHDLELVPGIHRWDAALSIPDGASISSAGAWIIREPNGDYAERMFIPQGGFSLDGLMLSHSQDIASWAITYVHSFPPKPGHVTIRNCVIRGGNLSQNQLTGWVVSDTRFERAGTGQVAECSVWLRCSFFGATRQGHHAFFNTGVPCLTASCDFENTNRAFILQGPVHGHMSLDSTIRHVVANGVLSGSECILLETGAGAVPENAPRDNTFVDTDIRDCAGPAISLYGSGHRRNRFWGTNAHVENTSLLVCEFGGGSMDKNEFNNMQCTGGLDFRGNIGNVTLSNVQLIEGVQRRGNSGPFTSNLKHLNDNWPIYAENVEGDVKFFGSGIWSTGGKWKELKGVRDPQ